MIHKDKMRIMRGILHLTAYDRQGHELWQMEQTNQIVAGAYIIAAEALSGAENAKISKVAAGTSNTPPVASDTKITSPTVVDIQTVEYPRPGVVRFNFTFGYNTAVGVSICEFGLLSTDGRLFARKVRTPIEKSKYISISGTWDITI